MSDKAFDALHERKSLAKVVSYWDYVTIGLGSIIGVGWILVAGEWLNKGGPLGTALGFFIGGMLIITIGKCYAELTPAIPVAGGEVAFAYKAFGTGTAFMTGWFLAFGYVFLGPFETTSLGWLFELLFPGLRSAPLYSIGGYDISFSTLIPGLAVGIFIIILNYLGVKNSAKFQLISMMLLIACALVFTIVAVFKGDLSNLKPVFSAGETFKGGLWSTVAILGMVPFFMAGFDTIPQVAEESGEKVEPKKLGKAIVLSIVIGSLFYCIVILGVSSCMPWKEAVKLEMPSAGVFQAAFGYVWVTKLVLITGFLGLVTSLNGIYLAATRVLFASGRGGLMPHWFGEISKKHKTPKNAILFAGAIALIGPFIGKAVILPIVNVSSLAYMCAWLVTCLVTLKLRKAAPNMNRPYMVKSKMTMYAGVVISAVLILLIVTPGSSAQLKWPLEYAILAGWMIFGYMGYRWRKHRGDLTKEERDYQILGEYR
ncbi:MAG: APC family permease [Candidatus Aminicenantes bacterium]|nr:APC family permease [Candidatus Aminicenantes bacterium]